MTGPLESVKVLDLSRLLPGGLCSLLLADLGADVIKIEEPERGDYGRWWGAKLGPDSGSFAMLNRNKRSLALNLKAEAGCALFRRLAAGADVVIDGFRPGVMDRLGLGYAALSETNPRLVWCAITGYGSTGPLTKRAGHDINYLALNGLLSYCGRGREPTLSGAQIADIGGGGLPAAFAIAAALFSRETTGVGQFIDIAMTDGAALWNVLRFGEWVAAGTVPRPADHRLNHGVACYNVYETSDRRYMALGALEPKFWATFCRTIGRTDLDRPDYLETGPHQETIQREVAAVFKRKTQAEWIAALADEDDCCCEPVLTLPEAAAHPQAQARDMVVEVDDPRRGRHLELGIATKFSATPGSVRRPAPALGEHSREVLAEIGVPEAEIAALADDGVI